MTVSGFEKSSPFRLRNGVNELIASGSSAPVTVLVRESSELLLHEVKLIFLPINARLPLAFADSQGIKYEP